MTGETLLARRKSLVVGALLLAAGGLFAAREMPRRLEPTVDPALAAVEATLPGVSARELEEVLTVRIEEALLELPAVRGVRGRTRDGAALLTVELARDGAAARADALLTIDERLERLREEFAESFVGLKGPHLRRLDDPLAEAVLVVAAEGDDVAAAVDAGERLARELRRRREVAAVEVIGRPREAIRLTYDDRDLVDTGVTPLELRELLRAHHLTAPGTYWSEDGRIVPLEARSRLDGRAALEALEIRDPADGDPVAVSRLLDVETVELRPVLERVRAGRRPAVALAATRSADASLEAFGAAVRAAATGFSSPAAKAEVVALQADAVRDEVDGFDAALGQSFVLILVLLVLLLGLRAGAAVALLVPAVVLTSVGLLSLGGVSLDVVTLSSLVLVLGLLVDNHVVMAERVQRHGEEGLERSAAVGRAISALKGPLAAASATTALGFLPVARTDDVIGDYVRSLFWVVLATLAVSLVFAFTVTPVLVRGVPRATAGRPGLAERTYRRLLGVSVRAPSLAFLVVLVLGAIGWRTFVEADRIFFPASARPLWSIEIERPAGDTLDRTAETLASLEARLDEERAAPDGALAGAVSFLGRSAPRFQASLPVVRMSPHTAHVLLRLDPDRDPSRLERTLRDWIASTSTEARVRLRPVRLGAELEWPVEIELRGEDEETLRRAADDVAARVEARGGAWVHDDWGAPIRKRSVSLDRVALAERDLTAADVTAAIHTAVVGLPVFDLPDGRGGRRPVLLRARSDRDDREEALEDAYVWPAKGDPAVLYEVAKVEEHLASPVRARRDGRPAITVLADAPDEGRGLRLEEEVAGELGEVEAAFPGVDAAVRGISASAERANRALLDEVPLALLLVLVLLLLQSQSIRETLLTLLTIPVSFAGVAFGLGVTGEPFSFMTLVGMTALAGIVVNNAIVLLASVRARLREAAPADDRRALLVDAAAERLRPILLTTFCALASMVVLHRSGGPMWQPLATATISGLVVSTVVVLLVVPALYAGLFRVGGPGAEAGR